MNATQRPWEGETVVLLGGGPSLASVDQARLAGRRVIAVNRAHEWYPQADLLFFGDCSYWASDEAKIRAFRGRVVTLCPAAAAVLPGAELLLRGVPGVLSTRPRRVIPANSGLMALDYAIKMGAAEVILLGYDLRLVDGRKHHHDGYPSHALPGGPVPKTCEQMLAEWDGIGAQVRERGVHVVNAAPGSALAEFPVADPADALPALPYIPEGMRLVGGVFLPATEQHFAEWMRNRNRVVDGKLTYQYGKYEACLPYVKRWRTAVDVGANVGLWTMHMAKRFQTVHAFEPMAEFRRCWDANVPGAGHHNAIMHPQAVGAAAGRVEMQRGPAHDGGCTRVAAAGAPGVPVELVTLDSYELQDVDFLKIDCEGYELFVLQGAEATLRRCRPVVIVEQKPGHGQHYGLRETQAVDYLQSLGAKLCREVVGDYILAWDL